MLTDTKVRGLKAPTTGRVEYPDDNVLGLRVRVSSKGTKTFVLRKRQGDKVHNITLGKFTPRFGLGDARRKARTLLNDLEAGKGPPSPKVHTTKSAPQTFRAMLPLYLASKTHLRSHAEVKRILEVNVLPQLGDRMADSITRTQVTALIDEIALSAPVMARNVHAQLSAFYTWALPRLERLPANPCRDAGRPPKPKARDRVLSDEELKYIWQEASSLTLQFHAFFKLLAVTAQRREEVAGMGWAELNRNSREWIIPPERAKNGVANILALTQPAIEILDRMADGEDWPKSGLVLTTTGETAISGISKAKLALDAAVLKRLREGWPDNLPDEELPQLTHWRIHDLRRTAATGFQRLGVRFEVTEAVLNHVSGARGGIAGVYQRHDWKNEKRDALEAWARHLAALTGETQEPNVLHLPRMKSLK